MHNSSQAALRRCSKCDELKPANEYYKQPKNKDGLARYCRACYIARELKRVREHPAWKLLSSAKQRAKKRGWAFSLTEKDVPIPKECPVLGIPLNSCVGRVGDNSPTLDRIDTSRGYEPGNVAVISMRANRIKNDATQEDLERILVYMKAHR